MPSATLSKHLPSVSGPQTGTLSYFHWNPDMHDDEKPFEVLINLPSIERNPQKFRRTNQEFEDHQVVVEGVRGREQDITLNKNGFSWARWNGPKEWNGITADEVKAMGHEWLRQGYLRDVEKFIKSEVQKQDGQPVDFVKVFDYKLRNSSDIASFNLRTLDLDNGLDTMIPVTHPHVDQSFDGAMIRLRVHMPEDAERLACRRFRVVK
ncbi:hypothetical protein K505DRAFT_251772 [Melanomma pulvis-pyrius CBS 109.77]|uniref:Uncharacterized protein n=1 Tax=Melanomma pulvis-pyrius CBS 109.77 TaxID=1314802 RepID=A0A6A6X105_9PLEO|nr:hypothetical protein K505DRAFT_251772 [Melanomma pulvis-pyrius CBS 109.77]